jgi:outer membrane receptor protein involved in Fe transport
MNRAVVGKGMVLALMAGTALAAPNVAFAQEATGASQSEEIVVTAQRREERISDVPISITAITTDDIQNRVATNLTDIQASVPGLRMVDIGPGSQRIQLRGIAQYQGLPTVGNYINDFSVNPEGASGGAEVRLLDLERVEVLRGPQGALYGEGSMGGTIRYITARPDLNAFGGSLLGEASAPDDGETGYRTEAVLNLPIDVGVAGVRIAAAQEEAGGWIDGPNGEDLNDLESSTLRATFLLEPTPQWSIVAMAMHNERNQDYKGYSFDGANTTQFVASLAQQEYQVGTIDVSYDFGSFTLLSSTGYLEQEGRSVDDSGQFYNELFFGIFGEDVLESAIGDSVGSATRWAQEFRITSDDSQPIRYVAGVSYARSESDGSGFGGAEPVDPPVPGFDPVLFGIVYDFASSLESDIWAAYATVSYDISDVLTLDLGGRYVSDERTAVSVFNGSENGGSETFETFNPRATLTYRTSEDGIIFGSVAKGFRSGGFNGVVSPSVPVAYDPETLWTYEIGTKQSFANGRLYAELSLYYNDYSDVQSNAVIPPGFAAILNSGEATGPGVDFLLRARATDNFTITGVIGYNEMRFDTNATDKVEGDPLDLVPDWNASVAFDYDVPLGSAINMNAHLDVNYIDEATITLRQLGAIESSEARTLANARLGFTFGPAEIYGFVSNITDEAAIVNPSFGAFFEPIYTRPRTIGLGVRADF